MKKLCLLIAVAGVALLSQACARNYLSIRELPSDVARAGCARAHPRINKEIRIEKRNEAGQEATPDAPQVKIVEEGASGCASNRTQSTWLIFDYNGIETLYWCTPSHEMTQKPACIPVNFGGAALFPEPGLKHLAVPKAGAAN